MERDLQALFDRVLSDLPGCTYALAVDNRGYAPTHNSKFSQTPTGRREHDLVYCRNKRIFDDLVGKGFRELIDNKEENVKILVTPKDLV
mgnify:CR=1 FL=1